MNTLLTLLILQVGLQSPGFVSGVVRGANGMPAPGVRVYAIALREAAETTNVPSAFESLTQTDASGRYRLEIQPGRYYIASGSVSMPTYYPGTTALASARPVTVAAGTVVEGIDFSSFVPPTTRTVGGLPQLPPGSTGILSGVIRHPDGTAATGISVIAIASSAVAAGTSPTSPGLISVIRRIGTPTFVITPSGAIVSLQARTDSIGRYRLENVPPDTYYVAAGFAESPVFYPGTPDMQKATTITTTPTSKLDTLDFVLPPLPPTTTVSGRVMAKGDLPIAGASVRIFQKPTATLLTFGLPNKNPTRPAATARGDGSFEFTGMLPGTYAVEASFFGMRLVSDDIVVMGLPVTGVNLSVPAAVLSGRILDENGNAFREASVFGDAIVTTVTKPNLVASKMFPIDGDGTFSGIPLAVDEYRFFLEVLPEEYTIQSITAAGRDLLKETLKIEGAGSVEVEIRVARRTEPESPGGFKVSGTVLDSVSGLPAAAERVKLCCLKSGPAEWLSAPLRTDGSFEFSSVPRGRYTIALKPATGQPSLSTVTKEFVVEDQPVSGLTFASAREFGQLTATVFFEDGNPLPANSSASVVFTSTNGLVRVAVPMFTDGKAGAVTLPVGDQYTISMLNLPDGYEVKSVKGSTLVLPLNSSTGPIVIHIGRASATPPR